MKKKIQSINLILLFCSLCTFAQSIKVSKQDSLLTIKLFTAGLKAGDLDDFEEAISNFNQAYELRNLGIWIKQLLHIRRQNYFIQMSLETNSLS